MIFVGISTKKFVIFAKYYKKNDYLSSIYHTIVLKDILQRENVRNVTFLENLSRFIADNIGID